MKDARGRIFVRFQPAQGAVTKRYKAENEQDPQEILDAQTLFNLEQWMNSEVAAQAFERFKVGLRVHIPSYSSED